MAMFQFAPPLLIGSAPHAAPNVLPFSMDLAMFSLIVFLGLIAILGRFAWKPILQMLANREKRISDQIDSAHQANEKAQSQAGSSARTFLLANPQNAVWFAQ